jgi:hypothetical protein
MSPPYRFTQSEIYEDNGAAGAPEQVEFFDIPK